MAVIRKRKSSSLTIGLSPCSEYAPKATDTKPRIAPLANIKLIKKRYQMCKFFPINSRYTTVLIVEINKPNFWLYYFIREFRSSGKNTDVLEVTL